LTGPPRDGPLNGVRVIELASAQAALAGKYLGDLGADVIVVEPPGGHVTRTFGPFVDDQPGPNTSLWWWCYNTSKRSVEIDLDAADGAHAFRALVASADIVLEAEPPDRLASLGLDHADLRADRPELVWVSVTPYGRDGPSKHRPVTDLTLLAGAGAVWSCGYDDHAVAPVRPGGNQGWHIAATFAAMSALTGYLHRLARGEGQHVDLSMHAAVNITTEGGTFMWLVAGQTVQRQTGRHAWPDRTMPVQVLAADGIHVTTGFLPSEAKDLAAILAWLDLLGLRDALPEAIFLERGVERGGVDAREMAFDDETRAILEAGREGLVVIASHIPAYDFFIGAQERDFQCGIIYAPEEALEDPHFRARGFPVEVEHDELGRSVTYPGAPYRFGATPWRISRRPPLVGEHNDEVLKEVGR
jgi:crotonobetainyl-CoA:carnitine CoA-transferase CaiB-like acyl-CoA transferase